MERYQVVSEPNIWTSDIFFDRQDKEGELQVAFCPTHEMIGNFFTKPFPGALFAQMCEKILCLPSEVHSPSSITQIATSLGGVPTILPAHPLNAPDLTSAPVENPMASDNWAAALSAISSQGLGSLSMFHINDTQFSILFG